MATLTLPGADIRSYYHQLGIRLSAQARVEAPVRCFADPSVHRREDRDASCSVNLLSGAWKCHACGARGGSYDAAMAVGHTPRSAIDLMIANGLIEPRARLRTARELLHTPGRPSASLARTNARTRGTQDLVARPALQVTDHDIAGRQAALSRRPSLMARLLRERGWRYPTIRALELGLDRGRITIPRRRGLAERGSPATSRTARSREEGAARVSRATTASRTTAPANGMSRPSVCLPLRPQETRAPTSPRRSSAARPR